MYRTDGARREEVEELRFKTFSNIQFIGEVIMSS